MFNAKQAVYGAVGFCLLWCATGWGTVNLLDEDGWKVNFGGFVDLDIISDSTRSLTEVAGNAPIDRPDTANGQNGRTQMSVRNSRIDFGVVAPETGGWKTQGYLEFDLLGYDPTPAAAAPANSESSFFTNPTLRLRHAYLAAENNGWKILAGQYWTLFGWQASYLPCTASVPPVSGESYERTPQVLIVKTSELAETTTLQAALAINRPVQRDSQLPGIDAGLRLALGSRKAPFTSYTGDLKAEPMSIAITGTARDFAVPTGTTSATHYTGGAGAVDALIPIVASSDDKDMSNTLALVGEYTVGKGYADEFPSFTGNLPQFVNSAAAPGMPNLDPGQGGYTSGMFKLVELQTFNAGLQYHLPSGWDSFVNVGYAQLHATNVDTMTASAGKVVYQKAETFFVSVFHDFSAQIRAAAEFDHFRTTYADGVQNEDNRYQVSGYFRF